jgi:hypothetical protein
MEKSPVNIKILLQRLFFDRVLELTTKKHYNTLKLYISQCKREEFYEIRKS